jgi:hypothetical protein
MITFPWTLASMKPGLVKEMIPIYALGFVL